jgi:hypothetical protein
MRAGLSQKLNCALNQEGELFGFDSDAEMDWGTAWYRPIHINHWVSGGDYGYRQGTGKLPCNCQKRCQNLYRR